VGIHSVIPEIIANKTFTAAGGLISWFFVVTFVHPTYVQIALTWGFQAHYFVKIRPLVVEIQAE